MGWVSEYVLHLYETWRGGTIGRTTDFRLTGRGFESWLGTIAYWANYLHLCASVTKHYNLVLVKGSDLGWKSNRRPGGKWRQPNIGFMTKPAASWLPRNRDQLRAQRCNRLSYHKAIHVWCTSHIVLLQSGPWTPSIFRLAERINAERADKKSRSQQASVTSRDGGVFPEHRADFDGRGARLAHSITARARPLISHDRLITSPVHG